MNLKSTRILTAAALMLPALVAFPQAPRRSVVKSTSDVEVRPLQVRQNAGASRQNVVLFEDFNLVPEGTVDADGRYDTYLASHYFEPGRYIDNKYTPNSGTWEGDWVMAGPDGSVLIQTWNPQQPGYLATPMGDYSGDIVVTLRTKVSKTFYGTDEGGWKSPVGSRLVLNVLKGGYDSSSLAETDIAGGYGLTSGNVYPGDGWVELTYEFHNDYAGSDCFLMFQCDASMIVDDIKVVDKATYLAAPRTLPITDFKEDSFTISWDPVRRSFNYYIDLWKVDFTGDGGVNETYDFEDGQIPEGCTCEDFEILDNKGVDTSRALMLGYDEVAFETKNYGLKLKSFTANLCLQLNGDPMGALGGSIVYECLDDNGWQPMGEVDPFFVGTGPNYYLLDLNMESPFFADQYYAVRIYAKNMGEGNNLLLDDIHIVADRPAQLVRVGDHVMDKENDDNPYNYYDTVKVGAPCTYTFTGLDPEGEYYYRVRSHNTDEFSLGEKVHALGVCTPELLPTEDIDASGSFTVRWKDVPKAQQYIVENYRVATLDEDVEECPLLMENFSSAEGESDLMMMEPLFNFFDAPMDDYTDAKGWIGYGNIVGDHALGVQAFSFGYLITPPIMANPGRGNVTAYIDMMGQPGDQIFISLYNDGNYVVADLDDNGEFVGTMEVPNMARGERIAFQSYNYQDFALRTVEVYQNAKAGDNILFYDSEAQVPAGTGRSEFTGLSPEDNYAYTVKSRYQYNDESVDSAVSPLTIVDLANGTAQTVGLQSLNAGADVVEVGRYTPDGLQVPASYKGIVIVKYSDGTTAKLIVR